RKSIIQSARRTVADSGDNLHGVSVSFQFFRIETNDVKRISAAENQMSCGKIASPKSTLQHDFRFVSSQADGAYARIGPCFSYSDGKERSLSTGQYKGP